MLQAAEERLADTQAQLHALRDTSITKQEHQRAMTLLQGQWEQRCTELTSACNAEIKQRSVALRELQQHVQVEFCAAAVGFVANSPSQMPTGTHQGEC